MTSKFHGETYQPKSRLGAWMDQRLPLWRVVHESVLTYPTPRNLNYWWTFGGILAFCLAVQIATGIVLAMHYTPHTGMAFESVQHITRNVNYGWLLRALHANGASMFFFAVYIHLFRSLYYGSYKPPREMLWITGVAIFIVMIATAFMGYVLPWGQMSFWAATVITNIFGAFPVIGEAVTQWLWGGFAVGNPTLNRFYSLHYLLPFLIAAIVFLHVWALHIPGNNNPKGIDIRPGRDTLPFHPYYTLKDGLALALFSLIFAWFVFFAPDALGHPDNYIEANPLSTPAHIVPDWYFLPFYAMLRAVPSKLGGVLVLFAAIFILFLLPWLDRARVRSARFRPLYRQFFLLFLLACLGLGYLGAQPAEGVYVVLSRILTAYYFAHFLLVLPLLAAFERPAPVPDSILTPVLPAAERAAAE